MGQKVPPRVMRLKINEDWDSRWYAPKQQYQEFLHEDLKIRDWIKKEYSHAGIARVVIRRVHQSVTVDVHSARPAILIGRKGAEIEKVRKWLAGITGQNSDVNVVEIGNPVLEAQLVAENIARALQRKVAYRRAMKQAMGFAIKAGAEGIKIMVSGRLAGAEIARSVWYREGRVPLHTLRAIIDYGFAESFTTYGVIGVKVWIYKGRSQPTKRPRAELASD